MKLKIGENISLGGVFSFLVLLSVFGFFFQDITVDTLNGTSVDAVVVLGGGKGPRVYAAVQTIQALSRPPMVFVTGGESFYGKVDASHMKEYAISLGLTSVPIHTITTSRSTLDDAIHLKQYLRDHDIQIEKLLIVTSRFHTGRANWVFQKVFKDTGVTCIILGANDGINYSRWWLDYNMTETVLLEKARFLIYRLVLLLNPGIIKV